MSWVWASLLLTDGNVRSLLGNAMHLAALTSWLAYLFANVVRRDVVREYLTNLKLMTVSKEYDDDNVGHAASASSSRRAASSGHTITVSPLTKSKDSMSNLFNFGPGPSSLLDEVFAGSSDSVPAAEDTAAMAALIRESTIVAFGIVDTQDRE